MRTYDFAQRLRVRESQVFVCITILIGLFAGLAAVIFTLSIKFVTLFFFGIDPSPLRVLAIPTAVSFVSGILLWKYFPEARGSGVPQTEVAFHLNHGQIRARVPFGKFITGVLCIGCGHSMGREGPSVQIGAGLASIIGRWFRLSPVRARNLVPVAAAAALGAAFNTPIAAVLFALEEIIGDMNAVLLGSAVAASVTAVVVERSILGNNPVFHVPAYHLQNSMELIAYAGLGVVGGIVSLAFSQGLLRVRAFFLRWPIKTRWFQPAVGGLFIGAMLIFVPQVRGVGYEFVGQALNGGLLFKTMVILCIAKLVATIISYASGNAGGIFAPTLYLGAMAGGSIGVLVHRFAPLIASSPGAYALVGMGALFAGIIRAPLTSVFMIFELTQDYQIFLPLMIANMLSFVIARHYQSKPLYRALLEQDNVHLPDLRARFTFPSWRARDIMTREFAIIPSATPVVKVANSFMEDGLKCLPVGDNDSLIGLVTGEQIQEAMINGLGDKPISSIATRTFPHAHSDHPIEVVLERLDKSPGLLPVVDRNATGHLEGVITPQNVTQFIESKWKDRTGSKANV
jgi:CIC family chloride channel protein